MGFIYVIPLESQATIREEVVHEAHMSLRHRHGHPGRLRLGRQDSLTRPAYAGIPHNTATAADPRRSTTAATDGADPEAKIEIGRRRSYGGGVGVFQP